MMDDGKGEKIRQDYRIYRIEDRETKKQSRVEKP